MSSLSSTGISQYPIANSFVDKRKVASTEVVLGKYKPPIPESEMNLAQRHALGRYSMRALATDISNVEAGYKAEDLMLKSKSAITDYYAAARQGMDEEAKVAFDRLAESRKTLLARRKQIANGEQLSFTPRSGESGWQTGVHTEGSYNKSATLTAIDDELKAIEVDRMTSAATVSNVDGNLEKTAKDAHKLLDGDTKLSNKGNIHSEGSNTARKLRNKGVKSAEALERKSVEYNKLFGKGTTGAKGGSEGVTKSVTNALEHCPGWAKATGAAVAALALYGGVKALSPGQPQYQ